MRAKITASLLSIVLALGLMPLPAFAEAGGALQGAEASSLIQGTGELRQAAGPMFDPSEISVVITDRAGNVKDTATAGDTVCVSMPVADGEGGSGIGDCSFCYVSPRSVVDKLPETNYDVESGRMIAMLEVDDGFTEAGPWQLRFVEATDGLGKVRLYNERLCPGEENKADLSNGDFKVVLSQLLPDLSTTGQNDSGYKLVVDGTDANSCFFLGEGGSVTPTVKAYYQDEQGARELLPADKYTVAFEKKTGDDQWERVEAPLAAGESAATTYHATIKAKEGSGYTNSAGPVEFQIIVRLRVDFRTNGGSSVEAQEVIKGQSATKPADPTRKDFSFSQWCSDSSLTSEYNFNAPVTTNTTVYAKWATVLSVGSYESSSGTSSKGGRFTVAADPGGQSGEPSYGGDDYLLDDRAHVTLTAQADEGFEFVGWFKGASAGGGTQAIVPLDMTDPANLLSSDVGYSFDLTGPTVVCPVFQCAGHREAEVIEKATPDADGRIVKVCSVCGCALSSTAIPRPKTFELSSTSFVYNGSKKRPGVAVIDSNGITIDASHYEVTYLNNVNAGQATARVTFKGSLYSGTKDIGFTIEPATLTGVSAPNCTYTGRAQRPTPTVKAGYLKAPASCYTVSYSSNTKAGKAGIVVQGKGNFTGRVTGSFTIVKATQVISAKNVSKTFKGKKLVKKNKLAKTQTINVRKLGKVSAGTAVKYAKSGKVGGKLISVNKKTGKLTVKKGLKVDIYRVKVKLTAAADANHRAAKAKTITVKVVVKEGGN